MDKKIEEFIQNRIQEFDQIPDERKEILKSISKYIIKKRAQNEIPKLVYICIHNSRRSHFGQIAGKLASGFYKIPTETYSGGTVATIFNINARKALQSIGFEIIDPDQSANPKFQVNYGEQKPIICFSKIYDDPENPSEKFAALMTCGEAEENCPFIPAAEFKTSTTYIDPSESDGTGNELNIYTERFAQILRENLYIFSLIK